MQTYNPYPVWDILLDRYGTLIPTEEDYERIDALRQAQLEKEFVVLKRKAAKAKKARMRNEAIKQYMREHRPPTPPRPNITPWDIMYHGLNLPADFVKWIKGEPPYQW